jgi:hypothetical protein
VSQLHGLHELHELHGYELNRLNGSKKGKSKKRCPEGVLRFVVGMNEATKNQK